MDKGLQRYGVEEQMIVKLKKAGTNPIQRETSWIVGEKGDQFMLEVGEKFHIEGQPQDVWWIVESIEVDHD